MTWSLPTAREALRRERRTHPLLERAATEDNPLLECGCGRRQNADLMADLRRAPAALRERFGGADFVCPACRDEADLTGRVSQAELVEALGAPRDLVARVRARAATRVTRRDGVGRGHL